MNIDKDLKKIKEEVVSCRKCSLYKTRTYPVIGKGSHQAKIIFVGEGPGYREDQKGEPFVGAAGKILDELLESVNIKREDVYIANLLKCRPPKNRDPELNEIKACLPYLERQISLINPSVVCTLGRYAMEVFIKRFNLKEGTISQFHGRTFETDDFKFIPLYHPAVAVYNAGMKQVLKEDFKVLTKLN